MKDIKNIATNIAGVMIAIGGVIFTLTQAGVKIPANIQTAGIILATVGGAIVSYFTGKNSDGGVKVTEQLTVTPTPIATTEIAK